MKMKFLLKQKLVLDATMTQFIRIELGTQASDEAGWDILDSKIKEIDYSRIKLKIEALLIDADPEKLFSFMYSNFIQNYRYEVGQLREICDKEFEKYGNDYIKFQRPRILYELLFIYSSILSMIINTIPINTPSDSLKEKFPNLSFEIENFKLLKILNEKKTPSKKRFLEIPTSKSEAEILKDFQE
jgi:hypothetical protein